MRRQFVDRMADTMGFRILLFVSGLMVLPVLALGVLVSPIVLAVSLLDAGTEGLAFVALAMGGAIGIVGWLRARWGARSPERHNVTLTLTLIAIGIVTALTVGCFVAYLIVAEYRAAWGWTASGLLAPVAFVVAQGVWVVSGIAWIERLMFSYAVRTGRIFDAIPVALLLVALGLAFAVLLALATLT